MLAALLCLLPVSRLLQPCVACLPASGNERARVICLPALLVTQRLASGKPPCASTVGLTGRKAGHARLCSIAMRHTSDWQGSGAWQHKRTPALHRTAPRRTTCCLLSLNQDIMALETLESRRSFPMLVTRSFPACQTQSKHKSGMERRCGSDGTRAEKGTERTAL